jgi:hypothetical protein
MGDVRNSSPFAQLVLVQVAGVPKGVIEASGQHDLISLLALPSSHATALNRSKRNASRSRLLPAPRQKQPQISPIFISDKVTIHVSREKDKELHLVDAGWDDTKVVQPDGCGQVRGGRKGETYPHRGSDDPIKN